MPKPPKAHNEIEGDPKEGDAILRRMLHMKPKPHAEMKVGDRNAKKKEAAAKRGGMVGPAKGGRQRP